MSKLLEVKNSRFCYYLEFKFKNDFFLFYYLLLWSIIEGMAMKETVKLC